MTVIAKDPVNQADFDLFKRQGSATFGVMANAAWHADPKKILFSMSRYKFVAKMLEGKNNVLEVGCADAFYAPIVSQAVKNLTVTDFDPSFVGIAQSNLANINSEWHYRAVTHDILKEPVPGKYQAAYSLDVMEHISQNLEDVFLKNIISSLSKEGELIIGMPTIESQAYASPSSMAGHVNCKTGKDLKKTLEQYFHSAFLFSMNDEVVHTGFNKLAHYIFVVCANRKC